MKQWPKQEPRTKVLTENAGDTADSHPTTTVMYCVISHRLRLRLRIVHQSQLSLLFFYFLASGSELPLSKRLGGQGEVSTILCQCKTVNIVIVRTGVWKKEFHLCIKLKVKAVLFVTNENVEYVWYSQTTDHRRCTVSLSGVILRRQPKCQGVVRLSQVVFWHKVRTCRLEIS